MPPEITFESPICPVPLPDATLDLIVMGHGSGGRMSHDLVRRVFLPDLDNPALSAMNDGAVLSLPAGEGRLVLTTDAHVVQPLFFPGGDIGRLAVCGTVNDVAMMGGRPLWLTAAFVLEEGVPIEVLQRVVRSMQAAAAEANVRVVAGDTKVVERGKADRLFITTAGVGWVPADVDIAGANARSGDVVIVSGTLGDHGIAVLSAREGLGFETDLRSDVAPLNGLVEAMLTAAPGAAVHVLRDPTRGGLATTLNEIAAQSGVSIMLQEKQIPLRPAVRSACEMLGFDPLYVANEGKLVACVAPAAAEVVLAAMRTHPYGEDAAAIGRVGEGRSGQVTLRTPIGGTRLLDMLAGEMLPRIC